MKLHIQFLYLVVWWNWYSAVFFYKLIIIFSIILYCSYIIKYQLRWISTYQLLYWLIFILILLFYIIYFISLYCILVFTDIIDYQKVGWVDSYKITQGPLKWNWGFRKSWPFFIP